MEFEPDGKPEPEPFEWFKGGPASGPPPAFRGGEWINVTPEPYLPYAPYWIAWLEHARTCAPCTRATVKHVHGMAVYDDELCEVGIPLGLAVAEAVHDQHHASLLN